MTIPGIWALAQTAPGAWMHPSVAPVDQVWLEAPVPGTVGSALVRAGSWRPTDDVGFDASDFWYKTTIHTDGPALLRFEGLATIAEVFLDGNRVLRSENMFRRHEVAIDVGGAHALWIAFRSLDAHVATKKGRARWRPRLARPPSLRFARTLLLGHIPGWGPAVHAVGPFRPIRLLDASDLRIVERGVRTRIDGADGILDLRVRLSRPVSGWVTARCGTVDFALVDEGDGVLRGSVEIPAVERWWPHTHGEPRLYPVRVYADDQTFDLGAIGFRTLTLDRDVDGKGFGLLVNERPVFCRGACWTTADIVALPFSREAYEPILTLARDAGMNMIRVGGTMGYEGDAFYALCDELGILVWQDFAFSNFDYPADPPFREDVRREASDLLERLQASPALAVVCGGSEVAQQSAMFGMPSPLWSSSLFDELLREVVSAMRPDVVYTPHSPWGGSLPFVANEGISHYYGVSAHGKPIFDARRAEVRFSAESLGFANVPDVGHFELDPDRAAIVQPDVGERHSHDLAALWAFDDIRNAYTTKLYGIDVEAVRRRDPALFLHYARATSAEVMEATYAEWRRHGSLTRGALVWFLRDIFPGAGWGVLDERDAPKAAYFGLKRAFQPLTVVLTDEGLNGVRATLINETPRVRRVRLRLRCLREGSTAVADHTTDVIELPPGTTVGLSDADIFGGFFDTTYSFRFGEPSHDTVVASLVDETGAALASAFLFPLGRGHDRLELGLAVEPEKTAGPIPTLTLTAQRFAQSVRIECAGYRPDDNYFHLPPGDVKTVRLHPMDIGLSPPHGTVSALNSERSIGFGRRTPSKP